MNQKLKFHFFLVTIPGLEELAAHELKEKSLLHKQKIFDIKVTKGGVEYCCEEIYTGFLCNYYLRIPTRILLRISEFKARDLPKLYNKLKKIDWNKYIPGVIPQLHYSSEQAKIFDDRKVEKSLEDAIKDYQIACPPKKKYSELQWRYRPAVYIRNIENNLVVSLDTTGERLDRRGIKLHSTKAPMRESLAAGLFYHLLTTQKKVNSIYDPMCGSGTLLLESQNFYQISKRNYTFEQMPFVPMKRPSDIESKKMTIAGADIDDDAIKALQENIPQGDIKKLDIFEDKVERCDTHYLINPPYNKRIKTHENIHDFINKLMSHITQYNRPASISFIIPSTIKIKTPNGFQLNKGPEVLNGGLKTRFYHLKKN
jgi:putative N6-adenine-specific DNA methylase